jgi:hypothetical protein
VRFKPGFPLVGGFPAEQFSPGGGKRPQELLCRAKFPREVGPGNIQFFSAANKTQRVNLVDF